MDIELVSTPIEAISFITLKLLMLIAVLAVLTYLFLKIYSLITKSSES